MAKKPKFDDPLQDIDPIMEDAFSKSDQPVADDQPAAENAEPKDQNVDDILDDDLELGDLTNEPEAAAPAEANDEVAEPSADQTVSDVMFPQLDTHVTGKTFESDVFSNIPVDISVELGRSHISLKEIYELSEGSIVELERLVGEPLDLVVNGQIIAQGEVVAIDNNYGLRVTNILSSK